MWRCKVFLLFFFLPLLALSQTADTSYYVRFAQPFDRLLPDIGADVPPLSEFTRDSVAFFSDHSNRTVETYTTEINYRGEKTDTLRPGAYRFYFDKAGRLTLAEQLYPDGSVKRTQKVNYLRGDLVLSKTQNRADGFSDTVFYSYDRAGHLSQICEHKHSGTKDTTTCVHFLYDNNNRLIVAENIQLFQRQGTYTFTYNSTGKLAGRQFLNRLDGAVLSSDTLIYSFADEANTKMLVKHFIRPGGTYNWVLIDEAILDKENRLVHYEVKSKNSIMELHGLKAGWTFDYTYDAFGKLTTIVQLDSTKTEELRTDYIHGIQMKPDTIHFVKYAIADGLRTKESEEVIIHSYDQKGRFTTNERFFYSLEGTGKKKRMKLTSKREVKFTWK